MSNASGWKVMDKAWERMQEKAFTKWCNLHLAKVGSEVTDLTADFDNGLKLAALLEAISGEKVPRIMKKCGMRIQQMQNLSQCVEFLHERGIRLENISAEDICDGNLKLILGLVWTLIEKFEIADIDEGELNAKDALLFWCQKQVKPYNGDGVHVNDFHKSWKSGLAFCAIIHKHKPNTIPWDSLDKSDAGSADNLALAFRVAEEECGIPPLLEVEDMVEAVKPDERSVMTYVSQYYKYFAASSEVDTATRRIGNLVSQVRDGDKNAADYGLGAKELVEWIDAKRAEIDALESDNTLEGAQNQAAWFSNFLREEKPPKAAQKLDLEALFNAIQLKLSSANKPPFVPEEGLSPAEIQVKWDGLEESERSRQAAINSELARQKKLRDLVAIFNRKAAKLESWNGEKAAYLAAEEDINTLTTAQTKVKLHKAFMKELDNSQSRLQQVRDLGAQIVELDYVEKDAVAARVEALNTAWEDMGTASETKKEALDEALRREQEKDALRRKFADLVKDTNAWFKKSTVALARARFGNNLQAVEEYKTATLDPENEALAAESQAKVDEVTACAAELTEAGVTDNKYTVLTTEDIEKAKTTLDEAVAKRVAAWEAELERQKAMEEKRLEFAASADAFVESVTATTAEIDGFENADPEALSEEIKAAYDSGSKLQEALDALVALDVECKGLGITSNPHTNLTVPKLRSKKKHLDISVKNYLYTLEQERSLKNEYTTKTAELLEWIEAAKVTLADLSGLDNTLNGCRQVQKEFLAWRVGEKAEKAALKSEVVALVEDITECLNSSSRPRPAFAPEEGSTLEDINTAWEAVVAAEKERDDKIHAEVQRQERLTELLRAVGAASGDLDEWVTSKEAYLATAEEIDTLASAQVQVTTFQAYKDEYAQHTGRRDAIATNVAEIVELGYVDAETTQGIFDDLSGRFDALATAADEKEAALNAALASEQEKENARVAFAKAAAGYIRWCHDARDTVADYNFGFTLAAVSAHKDELDANTEEVRAKSTELQEAITAAAAKLEELGVTDNRHASVSTDDVATEAAALEGDLTARATAYEAELERQTAMEEQRIAFADAANEFAEWLAGQQAEMEAIEGDYDERVAAVQAQWQDGTPAAEELAKVKAVDDACRELGITDNEHTEHTYPDLTASVDLFNAVIADLITSIGEEKEMKERAAAQEAEWAERDRLEGLRIEYSEVVQALGTWLDVCDENVSEDLSDMTTVAAVTEQQSLLEAAQAGVEENTELFESMKALAAEIEEAGGLEESAMSVADMTTKFDANTEAIAARAEAITEAMTRAEACEAARSEFKTLAEEVSEWLDSQKTDINKEVDGELEEQLVDMKDRILEHHNSKGGEYVAALEEASGKLDELDIDATSVTDHTLFGLKSEWQQLQDVILAKVKLFENEIARKKDADVSPEQLEEFKQVFNHFDKDNSGHLNHAELKACIASLGREPTDDEMTAIIAELDTDGGGHIEFNEFIHYMKNRVQDSDSADQIVEAFATVVGDQDYITLAQLQSIMSPEDVEYLTENMPAYEGVEDAYDYKAWTSSVFGESA